MINYPFSKGKKMHRSSEKSTISLLFVAPCKANKLRINPHAKLNLLHLWEGAVSKAG